MNTNPILKSSLFDTPASMADLAARIDQLPAYERSTAYLYSMLAFNLAHKLVEDAAEAAEAYYGA